MKEEPLVSVIMIAYNHEAFIDEAIRGVMLQKTTFPYELIIADDASTDGTAFKAQKWLEQYPEKIRLIRREQNLGLQKNFLDAYSKARGKYLAICESDDHWSSSRKLARQVDFLEKHQDYTVCFHRVVNHYADNHTKSLSNPRQSSTLTLETLAKGNVITNLSVMYRKLPFELLPGWLQEIKLFDYAMHSLHGEHGLIGYMNKPMAVYRRHSRGIWSGSQRRAWELAMEVRERLINHFAGRRNEAVSNYLAAYRNIGISLAVDFMRNGEVGQMQKVLSRIASTYAGIGETLNIEETESLVKIRVETDSKLKPFKKRLHDYLSATRAFISKAIPVPRIR